jgi:hypothetical protein
VWQKLVDVSEVLAAFVIIVVALEAASTPETSITIY